MLKASARSDIYIINRITFDIDEVALIANIMISENELIQIVLSALSIMTE